MHPPAARTYFFLAVILSIFAAWVAGCAPAGQRPGPGPATPILSPNPAPASETARPGVPQQVQRLRVVNQSSFLLKDLQVRFPDERIAFGDVPGGATSDYREAPQGVYRYAAYDVEVDGKKYQQPVVDWIGESPMDGNDFTYVLSADPAKWTTEGQVIQLIQVEQDR